MEEIIYDTNQLIDLQKSGQTSINGFTTIFNLIEFPTALDLKDLSIIYPTADDYEESLELSIALLKKGTPMQAIDIMIATICIRRNLTLSTKDDDFSNIAKIRKTFKLNLIK